MSGSEATHGAEADPVILTVVLTHLPAQLVMAQLDFLQALAPESRFVACHGGRRSDFAGLPDDRCLFVDDPSLRGPHFEKSLNETLTAVHARWVRDDPSVEFVYLIEYDHLILRGDFEPALDRLARGSNAGLLAKGASRRNDSNWRQYLSVRDDPRLNAFIAGISVRDDVEARWGCLGTGMLMRRDALEAFCAIPDPPPYYVELLVPTVVYHLGFEVVDVDAISGLYGAVRWQPVMSVNDVLAAQRAGHTFAHPFKALDQLAAIGQVRGPGENSSTAARSG